MAMNRVQFQAGLSMPEFLNRYGSEQQCEAALVAARWPRGFACPVCGAGAHGTFVRGRRRYWQCAACRHQCSALSGTIFESMRIPTEGERCFRRNVNAIPTMLNAVSDGR